MHESLVQQLPLVEGLDSSLLEGVAWSHQAPASTDYTQDTPKADIRLPGEDHK